MRCLKSSVLAILICFQVVPSYACRFWVATGEEITGRVVDQLLDQPHSLKSLGEEYQDGWSVGVYENDQPIVWRSAAASNGDAKFDKAVESISLTSSNIAFAHLRRASSGCVEGVPNPHPFQLMRNGKTWLFGHNGGMKKQMLIDMIGKEYLNENPPTVCTENAPESWIDSELYFIYLMKAVEKHNFYVETGIHHGLLVLYRVIPEESRHLNFFLTDDQTIWAFRKGNTLFYQYDELKQRSYVASTIPNEEKGQWQEFPEDTIVVLKPNSEMEFIPIAHNVSVH